MFREMILAVGLGGVMVLAANAADEPKNPTDKPAVRRRAQLTEEQKSMMKDIREKYDKDKDGKLSAEERKAISEEDKAKMEKAGLGGRGRPDRPAKPEAPK